MTTRRTLSDPTPDVATASQALHTDQLREGWHTLMGPLGFSETLLWFAFVDATGHVLPALNRLPLDGPPDAFLADLLFYRLSEVIDGDDVVSVAMLITRPGVDTISPWDRGWARLFSAAAELAEVTIEPIFRANDADLVEVRDDGTVTRSVA
ncbi:hypothetical protein [Williamsia herbipolensis]|uniref:hypothetical protein n=1 Tax=Williamsia herbipolensis TaxID=1603258 RepID=UPI0005F794DA|nr:hypothetical protein [Williamsia herbipolensis]